MPHPVFDRLGDFIRALDQAGELKRITAPVSPHIEISRYTDAESKAPEGGRALLFTNVTGHRFPVATNLFGGPRRICMALGVDDLDDLGRRVREWIEMDPPRSLKQALKSLPMAAELTRYFPRMVKGKAPCQEVVRTGDEVDLGELPVLTCWPRDGGPFVTLPLVFTRSLTTGRRNVGMYRLQIFDRQTTGMHWHIHKDGSHYYSEYRKAGKRMPVSVAVGADPAVTYAATAPMPRGIDEMILAGFIRKKPVRMVKCITNDLEVPAEAEFVIEGWVDPEETRIEGPFGDHTGYYSLADEYPVFHVTAVTRRADPIYNATLVGRPPMEDCYLAKATERIFLPLLQAVFPEIRDYWLPWEGVFHNIVVVALDKAYPGHAHRIMSGLWGQGQMSFCKCILVVDKDINEASARVVWERVIQYFDPETDLVLTRGVLDVLDHSAPQAVFGGKIGLDLTRRAAGEPPREDRKEPLPPPPGDAALTAALETALGEYGGARDLFPALSARPGARHRILAARVRKAADTGGQALSEALFAAGDLAPFTITVLFDMDINLADDSLLLWKLFNNVDPSRDIRQKNGRMIIDACRKGPEDGHHREWPEDLCFDLPGKTDG